VLRRIRRFAVGVTLPIKGSVFLLQHRRLLWLAIVPVLINIVLYIIALILFIRYADAWFGLIMERPDTWYLLVVYYLLRLLAFLIGIAVFIFSFVFVGTIIAAPFLEILSERTEAILRGTHTGQPFHFRRWTIDTLRSMGHTVITLFLLLVAFPLSFVPIVGHATWLGLGWLLFTYEFAGFAMDRWRFSFREKWGLLLSDLSGSFGFGAAIFFIATIPLLGLVSLPVATVAGTMLFLSARGEVHLAGETPELASLSQEKP
jgi:CysZ protein